MVAIHRIENPESLGKFVSDRCPRSLVVKRGDQGYGVYFNIYSAEDFPVLRIFNAVGYISGETIEIYRPEWFSDLEAIAMQFEKESKYRRPVTIRYHESP